MVSHFLETKRFFYDCRTSKRTDRPTGWLIDLVISSKGALRHIKQQHKKMAQLKLCVCAVLWLYGLCLHRSIRNFIIRMKIFFKHITTCLSISFFCLCLSLAAFFSLITQKHRKNKMVPPKMYSLFEHLNSCNRTRNANPKNFPHERIAYPSNHNTFRVFRIQCCLFEWFDIRFR